MNRNSLPLVCVLAGLMLLAAGPARADLPFSAEVDVVKQANYQQTAANVIKPISKPYTFVASLTVEGGNLENVVLTLPTTGRIEPDIASYDDFQLSFFQADYRLLNPFEQAYPAGTYTIKAKFQNGKPAQTLSFPLKARAFPATPKLTNYAAAQTVNPLRKFTLKWDKFADVTPKDGVMVLVAASSDPGNFFISRNLDNPLPGTATSFDIPAGQLQPNKTYEVTLGFIRTGSRSASGGLNTNAAVVTTVKVIIKTTPLLLGGAAA